MFKFIIGVIVGIALVTIGASGVVRILDKGVESVQSKSKELAQ